MHGVYLIRHYARCSVRIDLIWIWHKHHRSHQHVNKRVLWRITRIVNNKRKQIYRPPASANVENISKEKALVLMKSRLRNMRGANRILMALLSITSADPDPESVWSENNEVIWNQSHLPCWSTSEGAFNTSQKPPERPSHPSQEKNATNKQIMQSGPLELCGAYVSCWCKTAWQMKNSTNTSSVCWFYKRIWIFLQQWHWSIQIKC